MPIEQPVFTEEELKTEEWCDVNGYEGHYLVSDLGRVKTVKTYHPSRNGRILRVSPAKGGYLKVNLCKNSIKRTRAVHKLASEAFLGPCPKGKEVNHKDTDKNNNRVSNLEYLTRPEHVAHSRDNGLMATGARHGTKTHPESIKRGDESFFRKHPEHLRRGSSHWTRQRPGSQKGEKNHFAKLTDEQRDSLRRERRLDGTSYHRLGLKYGINGQSAWNIVNPEKAAAKRKAKMD